MIVQGVDSSLNVIPLLLDASGNVIVSAAQLTTTGGKVKVDSAGRVIVAADEPSSINPTGIISDYANTTLAAGTNTLTIYTVAAGQRVRLTQMYVIYVGTVAGVTLIPHCYDGTHEIDLIRLNPVVSGSQYPFITDVLLEAGNTIRCYVFGATLNDDFYAAVSLQRYK